MSVSIAKPKLVHHHRFEIDDGDFWQRLLKQQPENSAAGLSLKGALETRRAARSAHGGGRRCLLRSSWTTRQRR